MNNSVYVETFRKGATVSVGIHSRSTTFSPVFSGVAASAGSNTSFWILSNIVLAISRISEGTFGTLVLSAA